MTMLLERLVEGQEQQNHLLKYIADTLAAERLGRVALLNRWKSANPLLSAACREAGETWIKVQNAAIGDFTEEVVHQSEQLVESDFVRQEMIDRYGPRLQHFGSIGAILEQLGSPASQPAAAAKQSR
jgi:hypothetical protein